MRPPGGSEDLPGALACFRAPSKTSAGAPPPAAGPWAGSTRGATSPGLPVPYDTISERRLLRPRFQPRPAATSGVWLPPSRPSPTSSRRAKRRSVPGLPPSGRSLRAAAAPSGVAALWALPAPAPHRVVRAGTRSPSGPCSRRGSVRSPPLAGRPSGPSWGSPLQSVLPTPSWPALWVARPPLLPQARAVVTARWGSRVLRNGWSGVVRLRTAGSPGVLHLVTVAALRGPGPGVGSWIRLAADARLAPPSRCAVPPGARPSPWPGPWTRRRRLSVIDWLSRPFVSACLNACLSECVLV